MKKIEKRFLTLQLFADGGAEGNAAGALTGATETDAASHSGEGDLPVRFLDEEHEQQAETGSDAGSNEKQEPEPDLDSEFDALIKKGGKYAEVYKKKFESALNSRMKENKAQTETAEKQQKLMQKLAYAYGKDADDIDGISNAIDADENFYSKAAMDAGMSVEAFKEVAQMRAENAVYKKAQAEQLQRAEAERLYNRWLQESEQVKEVYPGFDLEAEIQNPVFSNLLRNGFLVRDAYEAAHIKDILPRAMQSVVQQAETKLANKYASNQSRPDENASSRNSAATAHRDVASLTDEELDEIDRLSRKRRITLG